MSGLALIPWARTDLSDSHRLVGMAAPSLNPEGVAQAHEWGNGLSGKDLQCFLASRELTSQETAAAVAQAVPGSKIKVVDGLEEVCCGLWEGLTEEELRSRFPKVYKRWADDPTSVCPPEGEDLSEAQRRIRQALARVAKKSRKAPLGLVMGPVAFAVARCELEGASLSSLRELLTIEPIWYDDPFGTNGSGEVCRIDADER